MKNHLNEWNTFISLFTDWKVLLFIVVISFINSFFFVICTYSEIEFIKPSNDVKIQRKTITFTKFGCHRTIFINKMINSGIVRMFIFFNNIYIYIFYFISEVLCICTHDLSSFSVRNIFLFFCCNDFIFPLL
jgi:hypothetical protein